MSNQNARIALPPCSFPTVASVARQVDVSEQTVRRWIREGKLKAYRVGPRRLRVDPESLAQMVVQA